MNLQAYPARDRSFAREVGQLVDNLTADRTFDDASAGDLEAVVQAKLRARFPNAIVHAQDPFARLREPELTLYAYRDGRIRSDDPGRERLYRALADARSTCGESRRIVGESETVASIWSGTEERRHPPDGADDAAEVNQIPPPPHPEGNGLPDR